MTLFRKMMEECLSCNAKAIDILKARELIISQVEKVILDWKALGGEIREECGSINLLGDKISAPPKPTLKDAKIIMDEYIYSDSRFTVHVHQGDAWIFNYITDVETEGFFSVDFGMKYIGGCIRIEKEVLCEAYIDTEVTYKCHEEVTNDTPKNN